MPRSLRQSVRADHQYYYLFAIEGVTMEGKGSVRLEGLRKEFGDVVAVDGIDLEINAGEFFTLLGPSGCGKTTTLRCIAGLETPTAGRISISGDDVTHLRANNRNTSIVFQEWALFPHMSVGENISFGLEMNDVTKSEREERVKDALELVELSGYQDRKVSALSGGQKQRIAMARSLVIEPDVLLLDEPLASLDRSLSERLQVELKNIQDDLGVTFIYVTHDQEEALTMSDRIAVMNDGKVEQVGPVTELYEHPKSTFVAEFLGETNLFEGTAHRENGHIKLDCDEINVELNTGAVDSDRLADNASCAFTVRPESMIIPEEGEEECDNMWTGTVQDAIYKGSTTLYEIDVGDRILKVQQQRSNSVRMYSEGDQLSVGFNSNDGEVIREP
ncbi:ABC transporter ATP-binding protein [Natribaculum luteum]|uniref:Molybdate/tungstate import ATP-binding protein WtpC n=1 Tax=Natribaculum luteum TaxID=1586232 RepID=A0ABD5P3Q1_9EURY|nr:ABC transporter ATP-binding protein [Natribaculum luteum]